MSFWRNDDNVYAGVVRLTHWTTVVLVVFLFALGLWMVDLTYYDDWYQTAPAVHIAVGCLLAIIVVGRIGYRAAARYPATIPSHTRLEKFSAKTVHLLLYVLLLAMVATGYLIETGEGEALDILGLFQIPSLYQGGEALVDTAGTIHEYVAYSLIALGALHGLAALKHHFWDKDRTLMRMIK